MAAGRSVAASRRDPKLTHTSLRWIPCDSPLHAEAVDLLPKSNRLRSAGPDPYDDTHQADEATKLVFDTAIETLRSLDGEHAFGTGLERAKLVLGIWKGDQSDDERIEYARRLNPKSVVERFAKELAAGNKAFSALTRRRSK